MENFTCNQCENHCSIRYTLNDKSIADVDGYLCPKGMLSLIKELLPMNQKKEGMTNESEN